VKTSEYMTARMVEPNQVWHRGNRYEVVASIESSTVRFTSGKTTTLGSLLADWSLVGI